MDQCSQLPMTLTIIGVNCSIFETKLVLTSARSN
uniref:Uncharacterized protein n=1 Tax=Arundo donax TaxID=35708 RepID=A0A0A9E0Z4_ARUDO